MSDVCIWGFVDDSGCKSRAPETGMLDVTKIVDEPMCMDLGFGFQGLLDPKPE